MAQRVSSPSSRPPHVVVVGAGFGGLEAARHLQSLPVALTVIDRSNHHLFQPLLYQVATSVLSPGDIAAPIRSVIRGPRSEVVLARATRIDVERKVVVCDSGEVPFDKLIVATGATHSYFGHDEWAQHAPGLKTFDDALQIRSKVLLAFEAADRESDPIKRRQWMTFVVIGGGPTGVELAGALADLAHYTLRREFRNIDTAQAQIILLEGLPRILTVYPEKLSERARRDLEKRGVHVRTGAMVTNVESDRVEIGDETLSANTILWGAGVAASPLLKTLGVPLDRAGRVEVSPQLSIPQHPDIYVIGDAARVIQDGAPVPGLAPAAKQMGRFVAKNLERELEGKPPKRFHYRDKGSFAVVGRGSAVGTTMKERVRMSGWFAYLGWALVHVAYLIGFRNRATVMFEWTYYFFTRRRNVRIIHGGPPASLPPLTRTVPSSTSTPERSELHVRPHAEDAHIT